MTCQTIALLEQITFTRRYTVTVAAPLVMVRGWQRHAGGVHYLDREYAASVFSFEQLRADLTTAPDLFSPRPYAVGQTPDSSTGACVWALVLHLCEHTDLDALVLYRRAFGKNFLPAMSKTTRALAHWQGVTYPAAWTAAQVRALLDTMRASDLAPLAPELEAAAARRNVFMLEKA